VKLINNNVAKETKLSRHQTLKLFLPHIIDFINFFIKNHENKMNNNLPRSTNNEIKAKIRVRKHFQEGNTFLQNKKQNRNNF